MKPIMRTWRDGKAMIFALHSLTPTGQGRVLVRCEMLGEDLFVTHECVLTKIDRSFTSPYATTSVHEYLSYYPETKFKNIVYEHKKVVLQPTWEVVPFNEKYK